MVTSTRPKKAKTEANTKTRTRKSRRKRGAGPGKGNHKNHLSKWDHIMLVHIYRYARAGMPNVDIIKALKITTRTWDYWMAPGTTHPIRKRQIQESLELGRQGQGTADTFREFCYQRLSPELRTLWDKIVQAQERGTGVAQMDLMLEDNGERVRQDLFLHALVYCNFSPSRAMGMVGISKRVMDRWIANDPTFSELVTEIQWHKKNFYEERLVNLVALGDTTATIYANKTQNEDRGFGDRKKVDVQHSGEVQHLVLDLNELMEYLTEETKLDLLEGMRKQEEAKKTKRYVDNQTAGGAGDSKPALTMEEVLKNEISSISSPTADAELVRVGDENGHS